MSKLDNIDIVLNNDQTQLVDFLFVFLKNIKTISIIILLLFFTNLILYNLIDDTQKSEAKFSETLILEQEMTKLSYKLLSDAKFSSDDIFNIFFNKIQEFTILQEALISLEINDPIIQNEIYKSLEVFKEVEKNKFKENNLEKKGSVSIEVIGDVNFKNVDEKIFSYQDLLSAHIIKNIIELSLEDIKSSIDVRFDQIIQATNEKIEYLKYDHKESIDTKILLLNSELYKIDVQTQFNFKYALEELDENISIAKNMFYIEPQNDKIFGLPFIDSDNEDITTMLSNNLTNENDLFSTKLRIPLYLFGTKILQKEKSIIQERINKSENNLSRKNAKIIAEIKQLKNMYGDEFIPELSKLRREILQLENAKKELSDKSAFTLIQYNTDQISSDASKLSQFSAILISLVVGLFVSLIYVYFKEIMNNRIKQLQNN